jgi:hypothetical protein
VLPAQANADGFLPTRAFRYLHPPPALARTNKPPASLSRSLPLKKGKVATDFVEFTGDTQAGLGGSPGQLVAGRPATTIRLTIKAVNPPGRFPDHLQLDGNAYSFTLLGEPGNRPVSVHRTLSLAIRWPHFPKAIMQYRAGAWHQVCGPNTWQISPPNLTICQVSSVGIFAPVH